MSSILPSSSIEQLKPSTEGIKVPGWAREPLLHFMVLGALLFALDHLLMGRVDDPRVITIGTEVVNEARALFKRERGRDPSAEELAALNRVWLDNEVLYREGLALQVDRGDAAIRDRVIFKALSIVESNLKLPPYDDKLLRAWFEKMRAKYDEPARFDFQEAALTQENSEEAVRAFVATLSTGTPGAAKAGLRVFKGRPRTNLLQSYGEEFAKALEDMPVGEWRALKTREGWRAVQLNSITPPKAADYENLRGVVLQDWTDTTMAELRTAAVRALANKYTVKTEGQAK
jgi:hypothetical protein